MAGYGAVARLDPDLARLGRPVRLEAVRPNGPVRPGGAVAPALAVTDLSSFEELAAIRSPSPAALLDRVDRLRELWAQATFFLFSADSWR